ncbi:hypothetical protein C1H70_07780 [Halomonas urumqiensis]|uniref:Uncharacterized protein n=1 Tax=Halomonas urumqiensis TaxID=1684789 RepID=A0A2N7UKK7_9GAMM|nr:hypothetical protein C1H70_07780 [Halomonas urumqiensis]PTB02899.1 hypothetical protein C6V82_09775 [Halomonas urumqiensis]
MVYFIILILKYYLYFIGILAHRLQGQDERGNGGSPISLPTTRSLIRLPAIASQVLNTLASPDPMEVRK